MFSPCCAVSLTLVSCGKKTKPSSLGTPRSDQRERPNVAVIPVEVVANICPLFALLVLNRKPFGNFTKSAKNETCSPGGFQTHTRPSRSKLTPSPLLAPPLPRELTRRLHSVLTLGSGLQLKRCYLHGTGKSRTCVSK